MRHLARTEILFVLLFFESAEFLLLPTPFAAVGTFTYCTTLTLSCTTFAFSFFPVTVQLGDDAFAFHVFESEKLVEGLVERVFFVGGFRQNER